jgi:hypothetical protein
MNEQDVVSFFTGKGYEPHQAAGIAGNLVQESSLNPTAKNPTSGAFGFAQWLGPRKKAFMDFAMKAKRDIKDPLAQLEFIDLELNTTERKAKDRLLASRDATEAAINFSDHYERAGANEKKNATRANYANKILGAIIPSAQAGETMDKPVSFEEWVAAGKPKAQSATSEIPSRKTNEVKPVSFEEWVAAGKPKAPGEKSLSLGEAASKGAIKAVPDTINQVIEGLKGLPGAVADPFGTIGNVAGLASGGITSALPKEIQAKMDKADVAIWNSMPQSVKDTFTYFNITPEGSPRDRETFKAFVKPYSSAEDFKQTLANNPGRIITDLSVLASGGASLAGKAGLTGTSNALATAAKYTNPLTPVVAGVSKVAPVVGRAAAIPVNYIRDVTNPKLAALATAAEGRGQQIVNALRGQTQIVPGSMPTAGQAAADVGATRYAALQAEVAKELPTEYLNRANQQAAAQVAQIQDIGKTKLDLNVANKFRGQVTDPLYTAARAAGDVVDVNPILAKIDDVITKNPGNKELLTEFNAIRGGLVDANGMPRTNAQEISSAIDGLKTAISKKENAFIKKQLTALKTDLTKAVPGYEIAQKTFASMSKPINQMEVGQYLENKLTGALSEGKIRPGVFATAVKEAPTTLKRVTGESRFNTLDEILTPDQMGKVQSVIDDLARDEKFNIQARAGAKGGEVLPATAIGTIPNWLNKVVTAANMIITRLQGKIDKATAIDLATEMLDPAKAAASMEKALARQAKFAAKSGKVKAVAKATADVAKSPKALAAVNALAAQQQAQNQNALAQ